MPASAGLCWLVCAGCVWFGVGWDSLVGSFICSIPSGGCSLVCGDARSPAGRSGFLLFAGVLDDCFDFLFGDLWHQWRDLIEAVSGLMPFDDHVSRVGGITIRDIQNDLEARHKQAFDPLGLDTGAGPCAR